MRTILIADRERSIRKALELYFISRKDFVFMVNSSKEAQALLKTADINIVIYDMQISGIPAAELYRQSRDYSKAKFIFTSIYPELPEIDIIKKLPDCRYLEKPFTIKDINNLIPEPENNKVRIAG